MRLYNAEQLAARIEAEGADLLVVESDSVSGPVLDLPLLAIGSCRGDPTNVDVPAATAAGIPVLRAPGRNADAVAELAVALLFAVTRWIVPADRDVRDRRARTAAARSPTSATAPGRTRARPRASSGWAPSGVPVKWRFEGLGMRVIAHDPYAEDATHSLDDLLAESDIVTHARDGHARDHRA